MTLTSLLVGFAAPALAQVNDAYGGTEPATTSASSADTLPLSGLDLGLIAAGGIVLVALGFGLRRTIHT